MNRQERQIRKILKKSGLEHRIEKGSKHAKVFIDSDMVMVFSSNNNSQKSNNQTQIESIVKKIKMQKEKDTK